MKKLTALLLSLLLLWGMGTTAFADEVTISTTVPERHTVSIQAEGGRIIADNQVCRGSVRIERQKEQSWWIVPDAGNVLSALYYNGQDVTVRVRSGVFTAPPLTGDAELLAVFADAPSSSQDEQYDVSGTVIGPDGSPVPGATVDIGGQTGTTDENGNFTVEDVPPGTWIVTVTDPDGSVIGIGEITITEPEGDSLTVTADEDGNPVITPGGGTTAIELPLIIGGDGVISIGDVKDAAPSREEPEQPGDTGTPGSQTGDQSGNQSGGQSGSQSGSQSPGSGGKTTGKDLPKTGDGPNIVFWGVLLFVSCAGWAGTALCRRKR